MNNKSISTIEEELLSSISGDFKVGDVLAMIVGAAEEAGDSVADGWLELVQEALTDKADVKGMMKLLLVRGRIGKISRKAIEEALVHVSNDRAWQAKAKSCDFSGKTELAECFQRLAVLHMLDKGSFCFEKTWGFGVVTRIDDFYSKVIVDFTRKKQHSMSFGYAGESLTMLENNHIFVLLKQSPEKIEEIRQDNPGEIVRMLLRSVGPKTVDDMKDLLGELGIVKDADWKSFWDASRRALKKDPLVEIPTKRTEAVTLLDKALGYDVEWAKDLRKERDIKKLLIMLEGLVDDGGADLPVEGYDAVVDRCKFIAKAAEGSQWDVLGRLLILGQALTDVVGSDPVEGKLALFFDTNSLKKALKGLNVKLGSGLLELMMKENSEASAVVLLEILEELPVNVIGDAAHMLKMTGSEDLFLAKVAESISGRFAGPVVFSWACRTPGAFDQLPGVGRYELVNGVIDMLEGAYNAEQLKGQNAIRTCFEDRAWLEGLFKGLPEAQLETIIRRIAESKGWESASRRSVLAKLLKVYPDMQRVLVSSADESEGSMRVTSWRSFKQRGATLKHIVEVDIPANSKEIGVAVSYGDLRENAEYKAAKEHQGILMRRQEELEKDLKTVHGTDFDKFPSHKVGPGTVVIIKRPSGEEQEYCVLGEWDRDEKLNVISSQSKLALSLEGSVVGNTVTVPSVSGEEECEVIGLTALTDELKLWVRSDP